MLHDAFGLCLLLFLPIMCEAMVKYIDTDQFLAENCLRKGLGCAGS